MLFQKSHLHHDDDDDDDADDDDDDDEGGGQCIFPDQVLRGLADYRSALLNFLPMN